GDDLGDRRARSADVLPRRGPGHRPAAHGPGTGGAGVAGQAHRGHGRAARHRPVGRAGRARVLRRRPVTDWTQTRELRLRASVLAHFELPWLGPLPEPAPVDALLQDCYRTAGADGVGHWVMPDSARREILLEAGLDRARQAWQALTTRPDTAEQQVI